MLQHQINLTSPSGDQARRPLRRFDWAAALPWLACVVLAGCATTGLTRTDVLRQYDSVSQLADGVQEARGKNGPLLAPDLFAQTESDLDEAIEQAREADKGGTEAAAERGLARLAKLKAEIDDHQSVMQSVLETRARALEQSADVVLPAKFKEADEKLREASQKLEEGERDEAKQLRPQLMEAYADLELEALKRGTVDAAKKAIAAAEEAGADEYAPATLREAREEVDLATSVLESDRTMVEKSNEHARRSSWLARRATEITTIAKRIEEEDLSNEEIVLWYQKQLQQVRDAYSDETLPFDQENPQVIQALRDDAVTLKQVVADLSRTNQLKQARIASLETELEEQRAAHQAQLEKILTEARENATKAVTALQSKLSKQAQQQAEAEARERRREARFEEVRRLFGNSEAEVFRQADDVLIRMRGFDFASGKSEIRSSNYPMLNNLVSAINTFPDSRVVITGHSDSRGSARRNLELSAARAQSVVEFLTSVGGIEPSRVSATGKGEEEPLASNETAEGRAKNRRIDVLIMNPSPQPTGTPAEGTGAAPQAPKATEAGATPAPKKAGGAAGGAAAE